MLSKWLYRLITIDGTWQRILLNKYLGTKPLVQVQWRSGDSHFWASLMKVKREFLRFGTFHIKNGSQVRFWEDSWLNSRPLRYQYPQLYNIVRKKQDTIMGKVLSTPNSNLTWRRDLIGSKLVIWNNLTSRLATVALTHEDDEFWWNLDSTGVFSVKSHYWGLINHNVSNANKGLWKLKIPLNLILKYFFGTLNAVSFSQRIILRNETGKAINSVVCHENKTIQHMFFDYRFTLMAWATVYSMGPLQTSQYFKYVWKLAQWNTQKLQISSPCRSGSLVLVCLAL